jgi:hypothetical protein
MAPLFCNSKGIKSAGDREMVSDTISLRKVIDFKAQNVYTYAV